MQKMLEDFFVGNIRKCHFIESIRLHKLVKNICTKHHRFRYLHGGILKLVEVCATFDDIVEECQASTLSTQRTFTDACELTVTIETVAMEDGNHTLVLHLSVTDNGIENVLAMCIHISLHLPSNLLQELRHREDGTGSQPTRHIIVAQVITERVCRQREDVVLQLFQVMYTTYLLHRVGITEYKVTKTKVLRHQILQILVDFLGVLVNKCRLTLVGIRFLVAFTGIEHQRHILIHLTNSTK